MARKLILAGLTAVLLLSVMMGCESEVRLPGDKQAKSAATDSARCAHYLSTVCGVNVFFGTEEECINAAITGKWQGEVPQWK